MSELTQPSDIARETLRRLALRRIPPTPENYRQLYQQISGSVPSECFPDRSMKAVASLLPRNTPEQVKFAREFETAVVAKDWAAFKSALVNMLDGRATVAVSWAAVIRELMTQLDSRHSGLTAAAKRTALEQIVQSSDNERLYGRLQGLLRSWSRAPQAENQAAGGTDVVPVESAEATVVTPATRDSKSAGTNDQLRELVAELLEQDLAALVCDHTELSQDVVKLAAEIRACRDDAELATISDKLKQFGHRFRWLAEDQSELRSGLLRLLQLLVDNIGELVSDDQWLRGQIDMLRELFPTPLDARRLDDVERRLKEVIHKQSLLKKDLNDAKDRIKTMLASFVDHLASFTETTGEYHSTIERCAEKISGANDISELGEAIDEVMRETRNVQQSVERSRQNMHEMKSRVEDADRKISCKRNSRTPARWCATTSSPARSTARAWRKPSSARPRAPRAAARRCALPCSISTTSRRSTTPTATTWVMKRSCIWRGWRARTCARRTCWRATVARSSSSCYRTPAFMTPSWR